MIKKTGIILVLLLMMFQSTAFAVETVGGMIFKDSLYGAVIGAILGGAVYLMDDKDFGLKIGAGVAVGTVGGLFFGIVETRSMVEIEHNDIKFALPSPIIEKQGDDILYSASLLRVDF